MDALDRSGWPAQPGFQRAFDIHGLRVGVRSDCDELLRRAVEPLPACWRPLSLPSTECDVDHLYSLRRGRKEKRLRTFDLLFHNHHRLYRGRDGDEVPRLVELHAERLAAELAPDAVFVHAGAVSWRGRGILLPGESGAGKTTLVAALVAAGAHYYSDEFAVLDRQGRLLPYARAPRTKDDVPDYASGCLPERVGREPVPVSMVFLSSYRSGVKSQPTELSPGRAVIEMMRHTPAGRARPGDVLDTLEKVVHRCAIWQGERGDARAVATEILQTSWSPALNHALNDRHPDEGALAA